jgi:hypothetical protein
MSTISLASRLRSWLRIALAATSATLGLGLALFFTVSGPAAAVATALLWSGLGLLVLIPVLNVLAVALDEWASRRHTFAFAAIGVILLLVATTVYKLNSYGY